MEILDTLKKCRGQKSVKPLLGWLGDHFIGHAIILPLFALFPLIANLLIDLFSVVLPEATPQFIASILAYVDQHPYRTIIGALGIGIFLSIVRRIFKRVCACSRRMKLTSAVGIHSFWSHSTEAERVRDWSECISAIDTTITDLRILGATGWHTFAAENSPLNKLVESFKGEIRILLMDPEADCLEERAKSIGQSKDAYIAEINKTIAYCKQLKITNDKVYLRLYKQHPIWKMIIAGSFLWLQNYKHGRHVDESPAYGFYSDSEGTSLYHPLYDVFYKRWEKDGNREIDL
ncbi:MAG TPA: hypothetical protein VIN07_11410 [Flavipsychrobacter sp.]